MRNFTTTYIVEDIAVIGEEEYARCDVTMNLEGSSWTEHEECHGALLPLPQSDLKVVSYEVYGHDVSYDRLVALIGEEEATRIEMEALENAEEES